MSRPVELLDPDRTGSVDADTSFATDVARPATLVLFDIDGTLLLSGGAGRRALNRAFQELFTVPDAFNGIPVAGRTDTTIFAEALGRVAIDADTATHERFYTRYYEFLEVEIQHPGPRKGLMPGVRQLLERLKARADVSSAIVTGNFRRAARIKLDHFNLWHYFVCGAFGDDAPERDYLVPIAVERAKASGVHVELVHQVVVVGDTPLDVKCAAAVGARSVAVATGSFDEKALAASGADNVLADLSDPEKFLQLVLRTEPD